MDWTEIATIVVPVLTFMGWIYNRIDKKIEGSKIELKSEMNTRFAEVNQSIRDIRIEAAIRQNGQVEYLKLKGRE